MANDLKYYCDNGRHLVCLPYSIENLHSMAETLGIKRRWFHNKKGREHYDIPAKRKREIMAKCIIINNRQIVNIIKNGKI